MEATHRHVFSVLMSVLLLLAFAIIGRKTAILTTGRTIQENGKKQYTVVLDAGHGGVDPGKVSGNHALEKDINLAITLQLKKFLEFEDIKVILTRDQDKGLYDETAHNKKVQDMKARLALLNEVKPDFAISIHQNSYPQASVSGAQVFYYKASSEGKAAAEIMQNQLVSGINKENHRKAKANDSYYLLKKTEVPFIIVECGFLSNYDEALKLSDPSYQEKMAWNIHLAILQYLNNRSDNKRG